MLYRNIAERVNKISITLLNFPKVNVVFIEKYKSMRIKSIENI